MRKSLILVALLLIPAAALAQTHRFEITPMAGWRFDGEFNVDDDFLDERNVRIDEGNSFGFIFNVPLTPNVQLEFIANRQNGDFVADAGLFTPERNLGDVTVDIYNAGISYQWGPGQVQGFLSTGLGVGRIEPDNDNLEAESRFSGNFGGGVKIFFAENIGVRLEGRGYWIDLQTDFDDDFHHDDDFESDEALWQAEASVGLIISW
ncbi:MAG TPA: outer membrane beta-barrel protein [Thermoanaerobaculia bacterium]|nr:outer membrane beta-barrel protein [Thermoanaerobaculia bacterium]